MNTKIFFLSNGHSRKLGAAPLWSGSGPCTLVPRTIAGLDLASIINIRGAAGLDKHKYLFADIDIVDFRRVAFQPDRDLGPDEECYMYKDRLSHGALFPLRGTYNNGGIVTHLHVYTAESVRYNDIRINPLPEVANYVEILNSLMFNSIVEFNKIVPQAKKYYQNYENYREL